MARVHVPKPLRELTGGEAKVDAAGSTVREVVDNLESQYPGLQARLMRDGNLRPGLAVFVDGANSRRALRTKLREDSELYFIESVGGGANANMSHN